MLSQTIVLTLNVKAQNGTLMLDELLKALASGHDVGSSIYLSFVLIVANLFKANK